MLLPFQLGTTSDVGCLDHRLSLYDSNRKDSPANESRLMFSQISAPPQAVANLDPTVFPRKQQKGAIEQRPTGNELHFNSVGFK